MKDPYLDKNGILRNKLSIKNHDELKQAEADICFLKLINVDKIKANYFDDELIRKIHRHVFEDIYEWAGEIRTVPIYKEELVLPGYSIPYSEPKNIEKELIIKLDELNRIEWQNMSSEELSKKFAREIALLWKIHPFRDGNTRTVVSFACMYAKAHGFPPDIETLLGELNREYAEDGRVKKYSIRDKFVLACLDDKDYPEVDHLARLFNQAIKRYKEKHPEESSTNKQK